MLLDLKQLSAKIAGFQNRVGAAVLYRNKVYLCNSDLDDWLGRSVAQRHSASQLLACFVCFNCDYLWRGYFDALEIEVPIRSWIGHLEVSCS